MSHYTTGTTGYVDIDDVINSMLLLMDSNIKNERYILVAENLPFKEFAIKVTKGFNVNPPQKEVSKIQLQLAWRLDWLNHFIRGKRRKLPKQLAKSISEKHYYSNSYAYLKLFQFSFSNPGFIILINFPMIPVFCTIHLAKIEFFLLK